VVVHELGSWEVVRFLPKECVNGRGRWGELFICVIVFFSVLECLYGLMIVFYPFCAQTRKFLAKIPRIAWRLRVLCQATQRFLAFFGFCDEPPGGLGGPARRHALELHNLTCFWCFWNVIGLLHLYDTNNLSLMWLGIGVWEFDRYGVECKPMRPMECVRMLLWYV